MKIKDTISFIVTIVLFIFSTSSCIDKDSAMGANLIPGDFYLSLHKTEFDIPLQMKMMDSLYTFYSDNLIFGSIMDEDFGLTTVSTAFQFIPDSLSRSYGTNPEPLSILMTLNQLVYTGYLPEGEFAPQNVYVHRLIKDIDTVNTLYNNSIDEGYCDLEPLNTGGTVIFGENGTGTEYIHLSLDFARELLAATEEERTDTTYSFKAFKERYKGLYIKTDPVPYIGGRLNSFAFNQYDNYSNARIDLTYRHFDDDNPQGVDSTISYFGFHSALNEIHHSSAHLEDESPQGKIFLEGLAGIKPYIDFSVMRERIADWAQGENIDLSKLIVTKAELRLPYEMPSDYKLFSYFPDILHLNLALRTNDKNIKNHSPIPDINGLNTGDAYNLPSNNNRSQLCYSINISSYLQRVLQETYTGDYLKAWIAPDIAVLVSDYYSSGYTVSHFSVDKKDYHKVIFNGFSDERKPKMIFTYALKN